MATKNPAIPADYPALLAGIKQRIRAAQLRAAISANQELIHLYWDIGRAIAQRQKHAGWGAGVIPRLARDLRNELPGIKGLSERNIDRMVMFYRAYPELEAVSPIPLAKSPPRNSSPPTNLLSFSPQAVAKMPAIQIRTLTQSLVGQLPWGHNILLLQKLKSLPARLWYIQQTLLHGWSRHTLALMIDTRAHDRTGKAITNFAQRLPPSQSDLAQQTLKDPYIFDFLTLEEPFHERELETCLVRHVQEFLLELGRGFAFVGRQYHLDVDGNDYYLDLLFYHLHLRCFIVIEPKSGAFQAEYAGKMNFYCNVVDNRLRHPDDQPTIGLILCQDRNRLVAEYALHGIRKAIGVSEYQLTRALPRQLRSSLPSIKQIETELSRRNVTGTHSKRPQHTKAP